MRPLLSITLANSSQSVLIGLATAPPKCPECKSRLGRTSFPNKPNRVNLSLNRCVGAQHAGVGNVYIGFKVVLYVLCKTLNEGEPISSSPSKRNFTLQFNKRF